MWKHLHSFGHESGDTHAPAERLCWDSAAPQQVDGRPPVDMVVGRFSSLDALFDVLTGGMPTTMQYGGVVRVHPSLFETRGVLELVAARERAARFGLSLLVTPAIAQDGVELRQYARPVAGRRRRE